MARPKFDYDRPNRTPATYRLRDWDRKLTPNLRVDRDLEDTLDAIACEVANYVGDMADENAVRTFFYNAISEREFDNKVFTDCVTFVWDFIDLSVAAGEIRNHDTDTKKMVAAAVSLFNSDFVADERDVLAECSRQVEDSTLNNADAYNRILRNIEDFQRNGRVGRSSRDRDRRDDRDSRSSRDRDRDRGRRDDRRDDRDGGYVSVSSRHRDGRGSRDRDRDRGRRDERDERDGASGSFTSEGGVRTGFLNEKETREPQGRRDREEDPVEAMSTTRQVRPADGQRDRGNAALQESTARFHEADGEPGEGEVTYRSAATGDVKKVQVEPINDAGDFTSGNILTPIGASDMDRQSHSEAYAHTGTVSADITSEKIRISSLVEALDRSVNGEAIEGHIRDISDVQAYSSIQQAAAAEVVTALAAAVSMADEGNRNARAISRSLIVVENSFAGRPDVDVIQKELEQADNLTRIASILRNAVALATENFAPADARGTDLKAVVDGIDKVITTEINQFAKNALGLGSKETGRVIDSFAGDYVALMEALRRSKPREADIFEAFSTDLFRRIACNYAGPNAPIKSIRAAFDESTSKSLGLVAMPLAYVCSVVPFTLREMGYSRFNASGVVDAEKSPFISNLTKIDNTAYANAVEYEWYGHIVVTQDHEILKLVRIPLSRGKYAVIHLTA